MEINIQSTQTQVLNSSQITNLAELILSRKGNVDFGDSSVSVQTEDDIDATEACIIVNTSEGKVRVNNNNLMLKVKVVYHDSISERIERITFNIGGLIKVCELDSNGECSIYLYHGATVEILCPEIDGASKSSVRFFADKTKQQVNIAYNPQIKEDGLYWIKKNGIIAEISEIGAEHSGDIAGILVSTDTLRNKSGEYIVPIGYLNGNISIPSAYWGTNYDFKCLRQCENASTASIDVDGYTLTQSVLKECASSGAHCYPAENCSRLYYDIGNIGKQCFFLTYVQMYALSQRMTTLTSMISDVFGVTPVNLNSGRWNLCCEYDSSRAGLLSSGAFEIHYNGNMGNNDHKYNKSLRYLPVISFNHSI